MACDPNTLMEQAKCLTCIPQGMLEAIQVSLLCQIAGGGGGGGGVTSFNARTGAVTLVLGDVSAVADARYVLKTGDTMTGKLTIDSAGGGLDIFDSTNPDARFKVDGGAVSIFDEGGGPTSIFNVNYSGTVGFFGGGSVKQVSGANLTNNVTVGGVNDTIADFTSLTVYATDAAAIRNDIYQLARKLKQINDGLRAYGLFT